MKPSTGHSRLCGRLPDEHVWDFIARFQRLKLVNLHPRYVSLEAVELEQQTHLRHKHKVRMRTVRSKGRCLIFYKHSIGKH